MARRSLLTLACLGFVGSFAGASIAAAQATSASIQLGEIAARFVAQFPDRGPVRVGIIGDRDYAAQLAAAFRRLPRPSSLPIILVDPVEVDRALARMGAANGAVTAAAATRAGHLLSANYVVVVAPPGPVNRAARRLDVQLIAVSSERSLDHLKTDIVAPPAPIPTAAQTQPVPRASSPAPTASDPAAGPAAVEPPLPAAPEPPPMPVAARSRAVKPPRLWPAQKIAVISGYALSAASAAIGWSREQDVRARRREIQSLAPGQTVEWNRLTDDARRASRTRDFWWSVAAGSAAVTTTYLVISSASPAVGPYAPTGDKRWRLHVTVPQPGIFVVRGF